MSRWEAIGMRLPMPKALELIFNPGGACLLLYSFFLRDAIVHFTSYNIGKRFLKVRVARTALAILRDLGFKKLYGAIHQNNALALTFVKLLGFKKVDKHEKQRYINYSGKLYNDYQVYMNEG